MVSIKESVTHHSKEDISRTFLKLYQKNQTLSIDTISCAHEVNLWCSLFLKKSLKVQFMDPRSMPIDAISIC
jgi:hypothetical protein